MTTAPARALSIGIDRDPRAVYDYLADPANFPQWASGLCRSIEQVGGAWFAETPLGRRAIRFTERNPFGVLDHVVVEDDGAEVYVPMRVVANGAGSELIFLLYRRPGMSDAEFEADAEWVRRDLDALKRLLESG